MKLLYVDAHHHYLNPTSTLLPVLVASAAPQVAFYGPGYVSDAELSGGICAYAERNGPYDAVIFGMQVPWSAWSDDLLEHNARHVQRYTAFGSRPETLVPFFRDVLANLRNLPIRFRFLSLLNFDYYATTKRHTDLFELIDTHVITPGAQFAPRLDAIPDWAWREDHFVRKKAMISEAWADYLARHPDRVLSLPHFVADSEFSFRALAERRHRVAIPGVEYLMRKEGRKALAKRSLRPASKAIFNVLRAANRLGIRVYSRYLPLSIYHAAYRGTLIDARFVYTAREGYGIPLRKFFEIPAAGAVLLCVSPHGFADLGFRDGENYLEVAPEALPDVIEALERDPARAQRIASAGRKLVLERHSLAARSAQFARCLDAIAKGRFAGSVWRNGDFEVLERDAGMPTAGVRTA
jgi:glycosyltransferase involved in cell wall biosynthesis